MRNRYWTMFQRHKYFYFYYEEYKSRCEMISLGVKVFLGLMSGGSIAAMLFSDWLPALWAILLAIAQLASLLESTFGYSTVATVLTYFVPDLDGILIDMEHGWDRIENEHLSDKIIMDMVHKFESDAHALNQKYLTGLHLSLNNKHCKNTATRQQNKFFENYEIEAKERRPATDGTEPSPATVAST